LATAEIEIVPLSNIISV